MKKKIVKVRLIYLWKNIDKPFHGMLNFYNLYNNKFKFILYSYSTKMNFQKEI